MSRLLARFADPAGLLAAGHAARARGARPLQAFTPYPVEGLDALLARRSSRLPQAMLGGGLFGACGTLALEYYSAVIDYPIDVGGRPLASWPAFGPPAVEMGFLFAGLAGILGLLWRCGLPRWHRPEFELPQIARASSDRFFLLLEAEDTEAEFERLIGDGAESAHVLKEDS